MSHAAQGLKWIKSAARYAAVPWSFELEEGKHPTRRQPVSGKIAATCERWLSMKQIPGYQFDMEQVDRVCRFHEKFIYLTGHVAGQPVKLAPAEVALFTMVYGLVDAKGHRVTRIVFNIEARKNGKTERAARLGLYHLLADFEGGPECILLASKEEQSAIAYEKARQLALKTPDLVATFQMKALKRDITATRIPIGSLDSKRYGAGILYNIAGDPDGLEGKNASFILADEIQEIMHAQLLDKVRDSTVIRLQPLTWMIGTGGDDQTAVGAAQYHVCDEILKGKVSGDWTHEYLPWIWEIDEVDRKVWWAVKNAPKANPLWGVSVRPDEWASEAERARTNTRLKHRFRQVRCNIWGSGAGVPWLDSEDFKRLERCPVPDERPGHDANLGLDMASHVDFTSAVAEYQRPDGRYGVCCKTLCPETVIETEQDTARKAIFQEWADAGHLIVCNSPDVTVADLEKVLDWFTQNFNCLGFGYDPYGFIRLKSWAREAGFTRAADDLRAVPNSGFDIDRPIKLIEADTEAGSFVIEENPCFDYQIMNAGLKPTETGGRETWRFVKTTGSVNTRRRNDAAHAWCCAAAMRDQFGAQTDWLVA